jgi:membrane-associated phospholipid phosphatase
VGKVPTLRLQRWIGRPGGITASDKVLVWAHWMWFFVPHTTLLYILVRHPERLTRAAVHTYATFDLGVIAYWAIPTAPPWYAAQQGHVVEAGEQGVRRMMIEYGEQFWRERWGPLYSLVGGNPLAAMPSLHFATSVMAAHMLAETGPVAGAIGWTYALTLGFALVYLGEHYLVDLIAGLTLTEGIRALGPRVTPALRRVSREIQSLEARAHA